MSKLTELLRPLLNECIARRGKRRAVELGHGLKIEAYVTAMPESRIHLMMWRIDQQPGLNEWRAVMKHWPWPLSEPWPEPAERSAGRRFALCAVWPLTPQPFEAL